MKKWLPIPFLLGISLGACHSTMPPRDGDNKVTQAAYRTGYTQGCQSAINRAAQLEPDLSSSEVVERKRYQQDVFYQAGWRAGYHNCNNFHKKET